MSHFSDLVYSNCISKVEINLESYATKKIS